MLISNRNIFVPEGNHNHYKGYWTCMFVVFIQESNDLEIASFLLYSYLHGHSLRHRGNKYTTRLKEIYFKDLKAL